MGIKLLRTAVLLSAMLAPVCAMELAWAAGPPATVLNRHLAKLLGTWMSADGEVTFNANGTLIYRGQKNYCAIAQGTIQISKRHTSVILPYRFVDGNLLITDGGSVTTYKRVSAN